MPERTYYTILIYLKPDQHAALRTYEQHALPHLASHGGRVELLLQPETATGLETLPDELHVLSFADAGGFARYRQDAQVVALASLREASVERAVILQGRRLNYFPPASSTAPAPRP